MDTTMSVKDTSKLFVQLRLTPQERAELKARAAAERRSMAAQVALYIEKGLRDGAAV